MVLNAKHIGVVGAGMMGSEIALVFALAGHDVKLSDASADRLNSALSSLKKTVEKGVGRGFWSAENAGQVFSRIALTTNLDDFADRDFVIEAVFEDENVKASVYRDLDRACSDACIIASNTSSISITVLASHLPAHRRPRFLGTHFFSPVSRMKLVEIIPGLETSPAAVDRAAAACAAAGKVAVQVKDVAGFAVNRLLHAFLIEAIRLAEEGVATPGDIDAACKLGLGHPIGPFEMMDVVSNSLVLQVQEVMAEAYGERFRPPPLLKQLVKAGYDGRKAGRGWLSRNPE
jgi:3-hydroxybutyryl-CoA dehydrogenase